MRTLTSFYVKFLRRKVNKLNKSFVFFSAQPEKLMHPKISFEHPKINFVYTSVHQCTP